MQSEIEKLKAGSDYCYDDAEIEALKINAIINCETYNSIDSLDKEKRYNFLKSMLGSVGEDVYKW